MAAYIIVNIHIHDPIRYEDYKQLTPASLVPFQGKFIVRGGKTEVLEGDPTIGRVVVIEFPDSTHARNWWNSEGYAPAKALRQQTASTKMILVEGIEPPTK